MHKELLDVGFIILSPEPNIGRLKATLRSIDRNYGNSSRVCIFAKKTPPTVIKEIKAICPAFRGQDTVTSLINTGFSKGHKEWNVIIMEGVCLQSHIHNKYNNFLTDNKNVFFPIVPEYNREGLPIKLNNTFVDSTLNGLCIHQQTFQNVGKFADYESFELDKLDWAIRAQAYGCQFKAILGVRIC